MSETDLMIPEGNAASVVAHWEMDLDKLICISDILLRCNFLPLIVHSDQKP